MGNKKRNLRLIFCINQINSVTVITLLTRNNETQNTADDNNDVVTHLFASVMHSALCVFQHLLPPEIEEVIWIRVEFHSVFPILSER